MDSAIEPVLKIRSSAQMRPTIRITRVRVDLVYPRDPYGCVRTATIDVQGKLLEIHCNEHGSMIVDGDKLVHSLHPHNFDDGVLRCNPLALLQLQVKDESSNMCSSGLILRHVKSRIFERVGTFRTFKAKNRNDDVRGLYDLLAAQHDQILSLV